MPEHRSGFFYSKKNQKALAGREKECYIYYDRYSTTDDATSDDVLPDKV